MTYRFRAACTAITRDPGHLPLRDRAVLRILNRAQAATTAQLTILAYRNRRLAQARLRRLWEWGYLERATLPPAGPLGGAPLAYRLSPACRRRLGYRRSPWRGPGYLAHTLDAGEAICALVRTSDPDTRPIVQLWLPESIVADALPDGPVADAVVVLSGEAGSAVICLEIDESTQHLAPIREKLRAYRRTIGGRSGWHVLFVVPTVARRRWLRRIARAQDPGTASAWVVTMDDLRRGGIDARLMPMFGPSARSTIRPLLADEQPRRSASPVASHAWLELLGSGGGEDTDNVLR